MAKCALLSDHTILFYNRLPYSSCIVQSAVNSPLTQCFLKLCLIIPTVFVSTPFPYQDLGFSSRESTEKASAPRPRVRVGDYIYLQYKAYCMLYKFGIRNTCNTFLYRCFLLWFNCRYNLFCEEINMFFNCGNSACPLLQFDKQQVYVEKRGDDWDNGRENKITQQEITTIKIDLSKTMHQKKYCCTSGSEKIITRGVHAAGYLGIRVKYKMRIFITVWHHQVTDPRRYKCLMDPRQLVLRIRLFFLSSVIRYIIQECVHTCLQSSSKLWDTTVQFH